MGHEGVVVRSERRGQNSSVRLEQKSVSGMKDLLANFSKGGQLVVDPCARMSRWLKQA